MVDGVAEKQYVLPDEDMLTLELTDTKRKDNPIGQAFSHVFSLGDALDTIADVYNGVSPQRYWSFGNIALTVAPVCFLVHADLSRSCRLV